MTMIRTMMILYRILSIALCLFTVEAAAGAVPAFPGAEGYGRFSKGGRGGDVYHVTNLNDSGPGSLREGILSMTQPRTIVFETGGTIELKSPLEIKGKSRLTIAGQTAPGGGICLKDQSLTLNDSAHVIVRYLRVRLGDENKEQGTGPDTISVNRCEDIILDHLSASWGIDSIQDIRQCKRYTLQWCIFSEALHDSLHGKGAHAMCGSFRAPLSNISIHHNLFTTSRDRHPTIGGSVVEPAWIIDFRNNVIYNWSGTANVCDNPVNLINNYFRPGPETSLEKKSIALKPNLPDKARGHMSGNIFEGREDFTDNNYLALDLERWLQPDSSYQFAGTLDAWKVDRPFELGANTPHTQSAEDAYASVLAQSGASLVRDAVDRRVIQHVRDRVGRLIDSQSEVDGWPELDRGVPPSDEDRDGMADAWETAQGLNPADPQDRNGDLDGDGYTNLEEYLHWLVLEPSTPAKERYLNVNDEQVRRIPTELAALTSEPSTTSGPTVALLDDDFSTYRRGLFSSVVGAHTEYHYLPAAAPKGNWVVSTFRSDIPSQRAWRVIEHNGEAAMAQTYDNKYEHYHPMLVTGDPVWQDYTVTARLVPQTVEKVRGIIVRYRNDRCYYMLSLEGQRVLLKAVKHATGYHEPYERILDERSLSWAPGNELKAVIAVTGNRIDATVGGVSLSAEDDEYPQGRVAIAASAPTLFMDVKVESTLREARRIQAAITKRESQEAALQSANPQPVLWKRIDLQDFGVGRNVRFGDLNNDGEIDVLVVQPFHHGPKDRNSEVGCMTAMTFAGRRLWQIGEADPWRNHLTNDVAVQVHDIDGDGQTEVVYCQDLEIVMVDGATGRLERSVPTPKSPPNSKKPHNKYERILGDSLYFCDLRGTGRDEDFLLKDRYLSVWAYDNQLNLLWHAQCNTGHYPYAYDVDGDGKDELMVGYTLFDQNGTVLWSLDDRVQDHADGVAIAQFSPDDLPKLLCAASDEGMFFADLQGHILKHHHVGHVQNPAIADFRPDLPGLEAVSINFWANQGIVHFFDAAGDIYHDFEPCQHGSMCLPINWTGNPAEFWVLSANVDEGGMFDGWGRRVVTFPADGHPDMCNAVLDITGDARDEVVVWDHSEMWVYTQDDNPKSGKLFAPRRNPLYNYSNYQTTVSLPGWTEQK